MGFSLVGAHVNSTIGGLPETIVQWKPSLVVVLDHSDVWHDVKSESLDTILVGRLIRDQALEPDFNQPDLNPILAARHHCDSVLPWARRMGKTYSFWQGVNEPIIASPQAMERFAAFDAERARIMDANGFQVVVGTFSVGNPRFAYWNQYLPALEAARQYHGALALHEYAWPKLDYEWPWYLLRHRKVYDGETKLGWKGLPAHLKTLPLLVTECGLDGLIEQGHEPRGWKTLYGDEPDRYLQQLAWYDARLLEDPYVVGAAIYCLASPDPIWKSYDIWPEVANRVAQEATPVYRLKEPEHPDEDALLDRALEQLDQIIHLLHLRLGGRDGQAAMEAGGGTASRLPAGDSSGTAAESSSHTHPQILDKDRSSRISAGGSQVRGGLR